MAFDRNAMSWYGRFGFITLSYLCLLLAQTQCVFGQVDEGAINGTVVDAAGAIVPNAHVTLLNTDQGLSLETVTNGAGVYIFSPVRIGNYTVTVTSPGFSTTSQKNLTVSVGQNLQVNIELKLGAETTTVEVTTAPPQLQTDESSVGQVVSERTVNSLPLNGRNFTFLAQLGAGVNSSQADTRGNAASGAFTANGLRPAQNNYLLDGIDNNSNAVDFLNGTNFVILPPLDAIAEFKVQTAGFSAELGRSAGAVLNATIKSGTNSLHGAVWEFFRNDKLDAADYFETKKGALRFNQFGATIGGPIIKNKLFFFGDYEGFRRVQGNTQSGIGVPTNLERSSGYTNLSELITDQTKLRTDNVGRKIPFGTILDPATTRAVTAGTVDPISGFPVSKSGYVRDPFGSCGPGTPSFSPAACNLNQIPGSRLDPNAIGLLNLYPSPTGSGIASNFVTSPKLYEHRNAFDVRGDYNPTQKEQIFVRFSYVDDPQFIPGPFGGIADGGSFQQGLQTAKSDQAVAAWTHVFTPDIVNVGRVGFNHLHTTRFGPEGSTTGLPAKYGIQGVPQSSENGGLPAIVIGGLQTLGSNDFLPSDEVSQTLQITDDFTKIYGKHSFKMGVEFQNVHFNTLQPAYSRGEFDFNSGNYVGVPGQSGDQNGIAQFLLSPQAATYPGGVGFVGGANEIHASNISKTYDTRKYLAVYFQDDWKVTPRLTLNLGLRWDYFSPISESNGAQSNFVQSGPPNGVPTYLVPASGKADRSLSSTSNNPSLNGNGFLDLLAKDGITLEETNRYGKGLTQNQKNNFAPRAGFAYQITPKFVMRGGVGLFYNAFESQGYGPNIGENYPFVYNFDYKGTTDSAAFGSGSNPYGSCATAGPGGSAPIGSGLSCSSFTPLAVNAKGLGLQGLQFKFITPVTLSSNFTLQYAITPSMSAQVAYVFTNVNNLQVGIGNNNVSQLIPANTSVLPFLPFPDFGQNGSYQQTLGISNYSGLQTKLEQQFSSGLNYLVTYTYSKTLSDAADLLNGGSTGNSSGFRAAYVPGLGPRFDYGLADFDIRNVVHLSGGYQLPFGKDKKFMADAGKLGNAAIGGWSVNWIVTLQGGQPITLTCPSPTTSGTYCNDVQVPGQSQKLGLHKDSNGKLSWFGNPNAFQQPCPLGAVAPAGCFPLTGSAILGAGPSTTTGPGFHRFDFSTFKAFQLSERFSMQFRAEFFNILNHPNFNAPNFGGNGVIAIGNSGNFTDPKFGEIGSTRDAPYDPRQIQFALKLYY
ncbi:TonB-dependent receptor [Tunturiibacter gelidoferens]|uniref:TonB-dependent transporter Oar-like beta-barrel domain-containing protein n=1 Tax=Tunturiibacter lichenicola TaxID=2051959 RepID=A0A7Y9T9Y0_9BACT|nr:TonB-dependent receptor [Edaphobacter lichenicola]NYF51780.1 hypothetical protein [Edaphobacter lichenicola]